MSLAQIGSTICRRLCSGLFSIFFTLVWLLNSLLFGLTVSGFIPYRPERDDWKNSPWALGFALPFTMFFALTEWFPGWFGLKITYTDEQLRDMREARVREIKLILRRRLPVEEACEMVSKDYVRLGRNEDGKRESDRIHSWFSNCAQEGDELWFYDTGGDSWEHLRGENGFAIVRNGEVVEWNMWFMN